MHHYFRIPTKQSVFHGKYSGRPFFFFPSLIPQMLPFMIICIFVHKVVSPIQKRCRVSSNTGRLFFLVDPQKTFHNITIVVDTVVVCLLVVVVVVAGVVVVVVVAGGGGGGGGGGRGGVGVRVGVGCLLL